MATDKQVHVLVLEDNPSDVELIRRELRKAGLDFADQVSVDSWGYLQALEAFAPDLILADYSLPGFDGLTALSLARQRSAEVPVIIVSGAIGEETAIEALKAGATDYVLKHRLSRLGPVVKRSLLEAQQLAEKRRAEAALQQAHAELEQRVHERTAELSQALQKVAFQSEQLRHLASELTRAEQRERQRVAAVLHDDLQQLLVGMKLLVSPLAQAEDPKVQEAGREIGVLVTQCLQCSRSLTEELSPSILHPGGLVPALDWLVRWMAERYHLTVTLRAEATVAVDSQDTAVLLFQAIRELLFNVVKHAHVEAARVEVTRQDNQVRVIVSDAGEGFDPASLRVAGGTAGGFGLFSIHERFGLLGGGLKIESAPEQGSRFTLWLPIQPAGETTGPAPPAGATAGVRAPGSAPSGAGARKTRVLVVDDHHVVRQGLARLLAEAPDIEVVGEAADGETAVALARELSPDVVIMDVKLPGISGIEATRAIHAAFPAMRVIGLSMYDGGDQQSAMRDAGAVAYVSKSGPPEELLAAIRGK